MPGVAGYPSGFFSFLLSCGLSTAMINSGCLSGGFYYSLQILDLFFFHLVTGNFADRVSIADTLMVCISLSTCKRSAKRNEHKGSQGDLHKALPFSHRFLTVTDHFLSIAEQRQMKLMNFRPFCISQSNTFGASRTLPSRVMHQPHCLPA
jgi:hypothetical protein